MRSTVTAILIATRGGEWLDETMAGIAAQTRRPDSIIAVNNGGTERVAEQLIGGVGGENARVIGVQSRQSFGAAVATALSAQGVGEHPETEWIWLLAEDSCPEPEALERIMASVQKAPSVVVAGPKLVDWDHPDRIIELGQSLTHAGSRWLLRRQELDQQQYDHLQDVLGVGPVGMLVRRDVWEQLGGFDPAYTSYDDALDFCVRTRLAGFRVEVSPESRVRFARSGVAGPRIDRSRKVLRTAHRQARTAHLHRRIAYAPALPAFFLWLGLPLLAILRVFWALIREQPGNMFGEFVSALTVFFTPGSIVRSRSRISRASTAGWGVIRPLRIDSKSVRTSRMIDREAILAAQGRQAREVHFVSTGGLAVTIAAAIAGIALTWWAIPNTSLVGGGLAPLNAIDELWRNTRVIDGVPADPFTWVLAVLGSLTFWNPSHSLVIFMVIAVPLSALGAWIWAAQITESAAARALTALGFALSPVLLGSIASGRITTLILAVVMPWLLLAATRCRESWSWSGTASLLAAVALACAPVLIPVALVFLLVGIFSSLRGALRVLSIAIAPIVLFAPKLVSVVLHGRPLDLFIDPGIAIPYEPATTWHLLLGFPEFGLEGWGHIFESIGLGGAPATLLVGVLLVPLALLALLGLYTGRIAITVLHALFGGLGMLTAGLSTHLMLTTVGSDNVAVWTGSGLVLYWLAILGLAAVGAETLRRAAPAIVAVALTAALLAAGPLLWRLASGDVPFEPAKSQLPALVQVAGEEYSGTRTLVVSSEDADSVHVDVVTGTGHRLDAIRTAERAGDITVEEEGLATLVGTLASLGVSGVADALAAEQINYVLLAPGNDPVRETEIQRTLDQHRELVSVGMTQQGLLWKVSDVAATSADEGDDTQAISGTNFGGHTVWVVQLVVLLAMFLLALPTGEVVERPERRERPGRARKPKQAAGPAAAHVAATPEAEQTAPEAEQASPEPEPEPEPDPDPDPTSDASADVAPAEGSPTDGASATEGDAR